MLAAALCLMGKCNILHVYAALTLPRISHHCSGSMQWDQSVSLKQLLRAGADSLLDLWSPGCCCLSKGVSGVCLAHPDRIHIRPVVAHMSPYGSFSGGFFWGYVSLWVWGKETGNVLSNPSGCARSHLISGWHAVGLRNVMTGSTSSLALSRCSKLHYEQY